MMKRNLILIFALLCTWVISHAQPAPYKVVIDVTSSDTIVHQMVIRWVKEIMTADPNADVEVVFYAKSLGMITRGKSVVSDDVICYAAKDHVDFKVCAVAMKNNGVEESQLLPGVQTVPDGIYEIISKQHEGWGYIKAAR